MPNLAQAGLKILIVDDNDCVRLATRDLIEHFYPDCHVLEARNGHEGLRLAQDSQPDLIFVDYHMPVMNGYEMVLVLQQQPTTRRIPLVLNTSETTNSPALAYLKQACRAILSKPWRYVDLETTLRQLLPTPARMQVADGSML